MNEREEEKIVVKREDRERIREEGNIVIKRRLSEFAFSFSCFVSYLIEK